MPEEGIVSRVFYAINTFKTGSLRKALKVLFITPQKWSHFQIVNLKGNNDDEIILQAGPLPFRWLKALSFILHPAFIKNWEFIVGKL